MKLLTRRVTTNKNLIIKTDLLNVVLPTILIDIDIYDVEGENKYLSFNKLLSLPYLISAYRSDYNKEELNIYVDNNTPIMRAIQTVHTKDNMVAVELQDMFITMDTSIFNEYYKDSKELFIPDTLDLSLDRTYNSKLVIMLKEDK